jgi:hypothetical protein
VVGAVTVTVTFAAKFSFCRDPQEFCVVSLVTVEVFTVPKTQVSVPEVTADPQEPWLVVAEVDELTVSLSVNTTPATGSPRL